MKMFDQKTIEVLAEAVHKVWMEGKLRDGWKYGPEIDKDKKEHNCLVPYDQLAEVDKESDRDMVRGMQKILAVAGYTVVKSDQEQ
jgi:hypothetical protein